MTYEEARNIPLYSLKPSNINYFGKDENLIIADIDPSELNDQAYQTAILYFDAQRGLHGIVLNVPTDLSDTSRKEKESEDNGKEALTLYETETIGLDNTYGKPNNKEEFISNKNAFYQSLAVCLKKQRELAMKGGDQSDIKDCSKWQRDYKKDNVVVLLTIGIHEVSKQYILTHNKTSDAE